MHLRAQFFAEMAPMMKMAKGQFIDDSSDDDDPAFVEKPDYTTPYSMDPEPDQKKDKQFVESWSKLTDQFTAGEKKEHERQIADTRREGMNVAIPGNSYRNERNQELFGKDTGLGNYPMSSQTAEQQGKSLLYRNMGSDEDREALGPGPGFWSQLGRALKGAVTEDIPSAGRQALDFVSGKGREALDFVSGKIPERETPNSYDLSSFLFANDLLNATGPNTPSANKKKKKSDTSNPPFRPASGSTSNQPRASLDEKGSAKMASDKAYGVLQGWKAGVLTTDQIKGLPTHDLEKVANVVYNQSQRGDRQATLLWQLLNR